MRPLTSVAGRRREAVSVANAAKLRAAARKPFRDNTSCCCWHRGPDGALAGLLALASRSPTLAPDFLTEFVLYALSATNLTMLVALRVRAGAQHRQAGRRAAARAAVRPVPRQAGDACCSG